MRRSTSRPSPIDDGCVENTCRVHLLNIAQQPHAFSVIAQGLPGLTADWQAPLRVEGMESASATLYLRLPPGAVQALRGQVQPVALVVRRDDGATLTTKAGFHVPR